MYEMDEIEDDVIMAIDRLRMGIDGKGITTLVLFHGCPLQCEYCINKECQDEYFPCVTCTPKELYDLLKVDHIYFMMTNGGVTFGGGEPLMNYEFIREFIDIVPKLWRIRVETSLNVPWQNLIPLIDNIDSWIIDIKDSNDRIYYPYTGRHNTQVLENLEKLANMVSRDKIRIRIPNIKGFNTPEDVAKSVQYMEKYGTTEVFDYIV